MKKRVGIIFLILFLASMAIIYAVIDANKPNHPLDKLNGFENHPLDANGNGIIDVCDSLSEPSNPVDVNLNKAYHSLNEISATPASSVSVDVDGNGWPDVCENTSTFLESEASSGLVFHNPSQITRTSTNYQSIDSDGNGYPDKGDCIISELQTDINNCGSCGNACLDGEVCSQGVCVQPVWIRYTSSNYLGDTDSDRNVLN
ncbi:hypothetical protein GF378_02060, partial [Candidatus Pacearchaeota archaeon]|nr:hypothetical protein [Candidatus Pacearchaeota archaeon]